MPIELLGTWPDANEQRRVRKYLRKAIREPDVWEVRLANGDENIVTMPTDVPHKNIINALHVRQGQTQSGPVRYLYRNRTRRGPIYAAAALPEMVILIGITYDNPKGADRVMESVEQGILPKLPPGSIMAREWDEMPPEDNNA